MTSWARRWGIGRDEPDGPPRASVLSPGPRGWLGLEQVRGLRVAVEDGALVVHHPDGRTERRAELGEVTRLSLHTGNVLHGFGRPVRGSGGAPVAEHGLLVAEVGDRPVLALWVTEWVPGPATGLTEVQARSLSGVDALAAALQRPVEAGDGVQLHHTEAAVREALVSAVLSLTRVEHRWRRAGFAALVLWGLSFFAIGIYNAATTAGEGELNVPWFFPVCWLGVAAATGLLFVDARSWRVATALIDASPAAGDGAWAPRPAGPVPAGFLARARLLVGPDAVVVRDTDGREAWLPGPARGGVTRTATTDDALVLVDDQGGEHIALGLDWWAGAPGAREALGRYLEQAGLGTATGLVTRTPVFAVPISLSPMTDPWFGDARESTGTMSDKTRAAAFYVALVGGVLSIGTPDPLRPVGFVFAALGVLVAATQAVLSLQRGRRARAARRVVDPVSAA